MSALELIKNGILSEDFSLIRQGYTALTGDDLDETPKAKTKSKKTVKPQAKQKPKQSGVAKKTLFGGKIQFVTDANEAKDNPKLYQNLPQKNRRPPAQKIEVTCKFCPKTETLYESQASNWICSKCMSSGKFRGSE